MFPAIQSAGPRDNLSDKKSKLTHAIPTFPVVPPGHVSDRTTGRLQHQLVQRALIARGVGRSNPSLRGQVAPEMNVGKPMLEEDAAAAATVVAVLATLSSQLREQQKQTGAAFKMVRSIDKLISSTRTQLSRGDDPISDPLKVNHRCFAVMHPITMYHGTSAENARSIAQTGFRPSTSGMLGPGVYCSHDINKARMYGDRVLILRVDVGRTFRIARPQDRNRVWQSSGAYDSAWVVPGAQPSGEETCVLNPARIKVITNPALSSRAGAHAFRATAT